MCCGSPEGLQLEFLLRLDPSVDPAAGAVGGNGHCPGVPFRGTCQPLPASDPPKSRSASELLILFSEWNALTAKLLFKIKKRRLQINDFIKHSWFFPASKEPFQAGSFPQCPVNCWAWGGQAEHLPLCLAESCETPVPCSSSTIHPQLARGFPQIKHSTVQIMQLGVLLV